MDDTKDTEFSVKNGKNPFIPRNPHINESSKPDFEKALNCYRFHID